MKNQTTDKKLLTPVELANSISFSFPFGLAETLAADIYQPLLDKIKEIEARIKCLEENDMPVTDYTPESLVQRAVRNARPRACGDAPRWVAVSDTFAIGSTYAYELCRLYDLDPDKEVSGARCLSCNP